MGGVESQVGQSMEPHALGKKTCLAKISDLWPGAYETLKDNNSNQAAFEWSPIQLFTFQPFVMRTKR